MRTRRRALQGDRRGVRARGAMQPALDHHGPQASCSLVRRADDALDRARVSTRTSATRSPDEARADGDREDHDRPAGGPQRVPAADDRGDLKRTGGRARGHGDRRDRADGRGRAGVLLGRGPAGARRLGVSRRGRGGQGGDRQVSRDRSARADPAAAEAGRGDGRGVCDRRRARAAPGVRPDDRRGQREVRPGGAEGGLVRRGLRRGPAGEPGGPEEGQGDLVSVPTVLGTGSAARWGW